MKTSVTVSLLLFLFLLSVPDASLLGQPMIRIDPAQKYALVGDTVALECRITDIVDLHGISVIIAFNKTILQYVNAQQGSFLTMNGDGYTVAFFPTSWPKGSADSVSVDQAIMGKSSVGGSGLLFTVRFVVRVAGISPVAIARMDLRNSGNNPITASAVSGEVIVKSGTNTPPVAPRLCFPARGTQLKTFHDTLRWTKSTDPDAGDIVSYSLRLSSGAFDTLFTGLVDTSFEMSQGYLKPGAAYSWYVEAHDPYSVSRSLETFTFRAPTSTAVIGEKPARCFTLDANFPNPFHARTTIGFTVDRAGEAELLIFDARGRKVATASHRQETAGRHFTEWDGRDSDGRAVPSGRYFLVLRMDGGQRVRTMSLVR